MQAYPRHNGSWTFYQVQSLYDKDPSGTWGVYSWVERFDTRERAEALGLVYEDVTLSFLGKIWQASGINATTNLEYASILLRLCKKELPDHAHRIVQIHVTRETVVMGEAV